MKAIKNGITFFGGNKMHLALVILFISSALSGQTADTASPCNQIITLEHYNKRIVNKDKAVLVYFSADWCTVCDKMKTVIETVEKEYSNKMEVLKVNTVRDKEITDELEINALPVLILYKNGVNVWSGVGFMDLKALKNELKEHL